MMLIIQGLTNACVYWVSEQRSWARVVFAYLNGSYGWNEEDLRTTTTTTTARWRRHVHVDERQTMTKPSSIGRRHHVFYSAAAAAVLCYVRSTCMLPVSRLQFHRRVVGRLISCVTQQAVSRYRHENITITQNRVLKQIPYLLLTLIVMLLWFSAAKHVRAIFHSAPVASGDTNDRIDSM